MSESGKNQAVADYAAEMLKKAEQATDKDEIIKILTRGFEVIRRQQSAE